MTGALPEDHSNVTDAGTEAQRGEVTYWKSNGL